MLKRILKSLAPIALLALASTPATAQPALPNLEIRITNSAPPRVRFERTPPRPDRRAVWVRGYWHWEGNRWDWVSGRWDRAENSRARWIAARYRREGRIWRYEPGHWSHHRLVQGEEYHRWRGERRRN